MTRKAYCDARREASATLDRRHIAAACSTSLRGDRRTRVTNSSDYNGCFHHRERGSCMSSGQLAEVATEVAKPREEWIARRRGESARTTDENLSQMHFARRGVITEEMAYVARGERIAPELVR